MKCIICAWLAGAMIFLGGCIDERAMIRDLGNSSETLGCLKLLQFLQKEGVPFSQDAVSNIVEKCKRIYET